MPRQTTNLSEASQADSRNQAFHRLPQEVEVYALPYGLVGMVSSPPKPMRGRATCDQIHDNSDMTSSAVTISTPSQTRPVEGVSSTDAKKSTKFRCSGRPTGEFRILIRSAMISTSFLVKGFSDHLASPRRVCEPSPLTETTSHSASALCHHLPAGTQYPSAPTRARSLSERTTNDRAKSSHAAAKTCCLCCRQIASRTDSGALSKTERRGAITLNQKRQNGSESL